MASNDVAVFLDLDNLVIGAREANLNFDVNLILERIKELVEGRIVVRRAYSGNTRQDQRLMKELAAAGFTTQATPPVNNYGKNLVDMYLVVDTMETLCGGQAYQTYVLVTGDRDFLPLVHALRRHGKQVIGVGLRHTTGASLADLCDKYIYYNDLLPTAPLTESQMESLISRALDSFQPGDEPIRASVLKERMIDLSQGRFNSFQYTESSFTKFLGRFPHLLVLEREGTTAYVRRLGAPAVKGELYRKYRSELKRRKLRVVPPRTRLQILSDLVQVLQREQSMEWRRLVDSLASREAGVEEQEASRNMANAVLLVARQADVVRTSKGRSLATAPVQLRITSARPFPEAVLRCDMTYLRAILELEEPFDVEQAAIALYDSADYAAYLQQLLNRIQPRAAR